MKKFFILLLFVFVFSFANARDFSLPTFRFTVTIIQNGHLKVTLPSSTYESIGKNVTSLSIQEIRSNKYLYSMYFMDAMKSTNEYERAFAQACFDWFNNYIAVSSRDGKYKVEIEGKITDSDTGLTLNVYRKYEN